MLHDIVKVNDEFPNPQYRGLVGRITDLDWRVTPTLLDGQIKVEGIGLYEGQTVYVFERELEVAPTFEVGDIVRVIDMDDREDQNDPFAHSFKVGVWRVVEDAEPARGTHKLERLDGSCTVWLFAWRLELATEAYAAPRHDEGIDPELAERLVQSGQARWYEPDTKPTNPKDAIGSDKLPLHLWPMTASAAGAVALLDGMLKYGRSNWREAGVRVTIYVDALERHVTAYLEGEECDPDSGLPHLWHALACLGILVDADAAGKLVDDRNYNGAGWRPFVEALTPHVARLKEKHAHRSPRHFTIGDNALEEPAETR